MKIVDFGPSPSFSVEVRLFSTLSKEKEEFRLSNDQKLFVSWLCNFNPITCSKGYSISAPFLVA